LFIIKYGNVIFYLRNMGQRRKHIPTLLAVHVGKERKASPMELFIKRHGLVGETCVVY
jgi:hypothetical protein